MSRISHHAVGNIIPAMAEMVKWVVFCGDAWGPMKHVANDCEDEMNVAAREGCTSF